VRTPASGLLGSHVGLRSAEYRQVLIARGRDLLLQTSLWRSTLAPGGLDHFKAYIWSAAVAHNLVLLARLKPA
jgi:hypothetical protein